MRKITAIMVAMLALVPAHAQWAVVRTSSNFLREKPGYEEENGAQELMGTVVNVLERKGYWVKVEAPDYIAWTNEMTLAEMNAEQLAEYHSCPKWICTAEYSHIFCEPSAESLRLCDFSMGDRVRQTGEARGEWTCVMLPSGQKGWVKTDDVQDFEQWSEGRRARFCDASASAADIRMAEEQIVSTALLMNGVPYMWGGNTIKYVDCSGLTSFVYRMNGILLPRNASLQANVGESVKSGDERPGDLLFFGRIDENGKPRASHVGIYLGDGKMIHSSQYVRINRIGKKTEDGYPREPIAIRRIIGHVGESGIKILE